MALTYKMREGEQYRGLDNLCKFIKSHKPIDNISIVEIGSYCGDSGRILAKNFPNGIINCVDPWTSYTEDCSTFDLHRQALELKEAELLFDDMSKEYTNVIKNKISSIEYSKTVQDESIDMVYIDGNHQYSSIVEDLENWSKKVRTGSYVAGHDYSWDSVKRAVNDFFKRPPDATFEDSSWIYIKP